MIIYHGSTVEVSNPQIISTDIGRDFGFAFYTTDIKEQAERWAVRKAKIENRRPGGHGKAVVSIFEWDDRESGLSVKRFDTPSGEWLDMVVRCRSDIKFRHEFDIVIGKIANDNVGETVSYVVQGIMRREDAIKRLQFERINNQIAFCSERALQRLHFIKSYSVGG